MNDIMKKRSGQEINIYIVSTVQRKQMVHNQAALSSVIVSYKKWRRNSENKSFRVSASRNEEKQGILIKDFRPTAQARVWSKRMCCAKLGRITPAKGSL